MLLAGRCGRPQARVRPHLRRQLDAPAPGSDRATRRLPLHLRVRREGRLRARHPGENDGFHLVEEFRYPIGGAPGRSRRAGSRPADGPPRGPGRLNCCRKPGCVPVLARSGFCNCAHGTTNQERITSWPPAWRRASRNASTKSRTCARTGAESQARGHDQAGVITDDSPSPPTPCSCSANGSPEFMTLTRCHRRKRGRMAVTLRSTFRVVGSAGQAGAALDKPRADLARPARRTLVLPFHRVPGAPA